MEFRERPSTSGPDDWLGAATSARSFRCSTDGTSSPRLSDFLLYDFVTDGGGVDENVFAYSNGNGPACSLVVYQYRFGSTAGLDPRLRGLCAKQGDGSKRQVRRTLAEGLGLPTDPAAFVAFRDARTGLEHLRSVGELRERGLFGGLTLTRATCSGSSASFTTGRRTSGRGSTGCSRTGRALARGGPARAAARTGAPAPFARRSRIPRWPRSSAWLAPSPRQPGRPATARRSWSSSRSEPRRPTRRSRQSRTPRRKPRCACGRCCPRSARLPTGADPAATSRAWYDELRLAPVVAVGLRERGLDEAQAWSVADLVRVLLDLPRPGTLRGAAKTLDARLLEAWLARDDLRAAIGVNTWEGTDWLDRDRFAAMLRWAAPSTRPRPARRRRRGSRPTSSG